MKRLALTLVLVAAAAAVRTAPLPQNQDPTPGQTFRAGADLVSLYITAIDDDRRLVADLTKDDFRVYDNGQLRPITVFNNGLFPFSVVMMLDRSGSVENDFELIRNGAIEFVRQMRPDDRARIGSFAERIVIDPPTFTSDRGDLIGLLRGDLQKIGPSPVWTAIDRSLSAVQPEPGRRVVLLFTDGHNDIVYGQTRTSLGDVMDRIKSEDVVVYAIGFASMEPRGSTTNHIGPLGLPGPSGSSGSGGRGDMIGTRRVQPPDPALKDMAEVSGGGYFELTAKDDLTATFARVAQELHRQYWIGFAPTKLDGKSHKIEVKVTRPGVKIRTRKSYVAGMK